MDPTIVSSLISAAVAIVVCVITQYAQNKKTIALIEYKIEVLTDKVDKHNNFDRRLIVIETKLGIERKEKSA